MRHIPIEQTAVMAFRVQINFCILHLKIMQVPRILNGDIHQFEKFLGTSLSVFNMLY